MCEDHRLAETTAHLATRYFDFALQKNEDSLFDEFSLDELRVACVLLAAKYDEHEAPPPRVLRTASNERVTRIEKQQHAPWKMLMHTTRVDAKL